MRPCGSGLTLLLGLAIVGVGPTYGALNPRSGVALQAGGSVTWLEIEWGAARSKAQPGFALSVGLSHFKNRYSSIETGIGISSRGGSWESAFAQNGRTYGRTGFRRSLDVTYVTVPLGLGFTGRIGSVLPYCKIGVQLGYVLTASQESRDQVTGELVVRSTDHDIVNPFHLEGWLSAGLAVPYSGRLLSLELCFLPGLTPPDGSMKVEGSLPRLENRAVIASLALGLGNRGASHE